MQRTTTCLSRFLGLAVLLLCGGCDLEFPEQEVRIRYDAEADTLDVLILYQGVRSEDDSEVAVGKGRDRMNRVLAGRREFMFIDWPFYFDLDEQDESWIPEARAAAERVQLVRVEAFLDEYQRLCVLQHFRLSEVGEVLADANRLLHAAASQALEAGEIEKDWLPFDEAEEAAWRKFIDGEERWVSWEDGHLVLRVPGTPQAAARALEQHTRIVAEAGEDRSVYPMLMRNLAGLQVADGNAELRLGRIEDADTVFRSKVKNGPYSGVLRDLLVAEGLDLTGAVTPDEARAVLDAEGTSGSGARSADSPESGD